MNPDEPLTNQSAKRIIDDANKSTNLILTGVIIVLFVGFLTMILAVVSPMIDAWRFRASSYENLVNQVSQQNAKIDLLLNKIEQIRDSSCVY